MVEQKGKVFNIYIISDEAHIFHSINNSVTFHPKLHMIEENKRARILMGSSNLTAGGLWSNTEINIQLELNLENDVDIYNDINNYIQQLTNESNDTIVSSSPQKRRTECRGDRQ